MIDLRKPWLDVVNNFDRTNTVVALVGLKSDSKERKITTEEATLFAKSQAMDCYVEVSSHDGSNLHVVYEKIAQHLIDRQGTYMSNSGGR